MKEFDVTIEVRAYETTVRIEAESADEAERIAREKEANDCIDIFATAKEVYDE